MKSEYLIKHLVNDLKSVNVYKITLSAILKYLLTAAFSMAAVVSIQGLRTDFLDQINSLYFLIENISLVFISFISILAAFSLSIPKSNNKNLKWIPICIGFIISIYLFFKFSTHKMPFIYLKHGFSCLRGIAFTTILPTTMMLYLIKRAAVLNRDLMSLLILISGLFWGLFSTQLTCADNTPTHIFIWHILPVVIIALVGIPLSKYLIRKV